MESKTVERTTEKFRTLIFPAVRSTLSKRTQRLATFAYPSPTIESELRESTFRNDIHGISDHFLRHMENAVRAFEQIKIVRETESKIKENNNAG